MSSYKGTVVQKKKGKGGKVTIKKKKTSNLKNLREQAMACMDNETRREHHNMLERQRRDKIKHCFIHLRDSLPPISGTNTNRIRILRTAIDFIKDKSTTCRNHELDIVAVEEENTKLEESIRELQTLKERNQSEVITSSSSDDDTERIASFNTGNIDIVKHENFDFGDNDDVQKQNSVFEDKFYLSDVIKKEKSEFDDTAQNEIRVKREYDSDDSINDCDDATSSPLIYDNSRKKMVVVLKSERDDFDVLEEDESTDCYRDITDNSSSSECNVNGRKFKIEFDLAD